MKYKDYLKSEHWEKTKALKSTLSPKRCSICAGTERIDLHHLFYRPSLFDVESADLRWLCRRCHSKCHELIKAGTLTFPKPKNHHSCFAITKTVVKKALGLGRLNLFYPQERLNAEPQLF